MTFLENTGNAGPSRDVYSDGGVECVKMNGRGVVSQQTRYTAPMLFYCWPIVCDAGLTVKQHRYSVPCLLG